MLLFVTRAVSMSVCITIVVDRTVPVAADVASTVILFYYNYC